MQVTPYLAFDGKCEEAFRYYAQHLGGKIAFLMRMGESPMADKVAPEHRNRVMHATLEIPGGVVHGADAPPEHFSKPQGFCVSVSVKEPAEAERIFAALVDGGKTQMPMQETFWAQRFGMGIDRFGIPWMVNCEKAA
jgi:PhnB protein